MPLRETLSAKKTTIMRFKEACAAQQSVLLHTIQPNLTYLI
jgi:hypothetical protein